MSYTSVNLQLGQKKQEKVKKMEGPFLIKKNPQIKHYFQNKNRWSSK
jgi:hypothetical protein